MSPKSISTLEAEKRADLRRRNSINTANYRARQAINSNYMKKRVNEILVELNRPMIDFVNKKTPHVLKGKSRPIHLPPEHERVKMTDAQLSEWKAVQRRKRKANQAKLRRAREDEEENSLKKMWYALEREIAEKNGTLMGDLTVAYMVEGDGGEISHVYGVGGKRKAELNSVLSPTVIKGNDGRKIASQASSLLFLAKVASMHPEDAFKQE